MDLIGHCAVAELSGVLREEEVYGTGIVELMFLNFAHCHDWAYSHCWEPQRYRGLERTAERIRAHMICDWVIHYGTERTHVKEKCGWAFQRMKIADWFSNEFFLGAAARGFFKSKAPDPSSWNEKKRLDFAHSFVEYASDILLARRAITAVRFRAIKDGLVRLACHEGYGSDRWVFDMFDQLGITSDQSREFISASVHQMARDATESSCPEEFATRTAIHKYGLRADPEVIRYVRSYLERIAAELDEDELVALCHQIGRVIRDPGTIYTGPWRKGSS